MKRINARNTQPATYSPVTIQEASRLFSDAAMSASKNMNNPSPDRAAEDSRYCRGSAVKDQTIYDGEAAVVKYLP
jgi:hypothetical protein